MGRHQFSTATARKRAPALWAQTPHVGKQAGFDPALVRDRMIANPECVILARRLIVRIVSGGRTAGQSRHGKDKGEGD